MKIERGTKVLVDTNVLLEATDEGRRFHVQAQSLWLRKSFSVKVIKASI